MLEFGIIGDGVAVFSIDVRYFLPYAFAVERGFVDAWVARLDRSDDRGDDTEASAVRFFLVRGYTRGQIVRVSADANGSSAGFEGSELEVTYFAGNR